ncbi:MAG: TonB-dependent receptor [Bacteroidales bacterium]|nr:TonB-dependent receptor [Bacteroidales bacterium]
MKHKISFIILLFIPFLVFSQTKKTDANIFGHVINKSDGKHVPYFTISIKGTTIGTTTDATGHYFLKNLPVGEHIIVASGMGYETHEKKILIEANKSIELDFSVEESNLLLEGVVVTASRNESNRREAASIVNIISPKTLENTNSVCVSQGLNFQPGLRVETNCQNCGFQQVRTNGLEGQYTQVLIDSRPIFSALASVYGIEQIPANMVEQIEIVRGGGSAVFGSSAIAGTVNIITKEPQKNTASLSNTTNLIGGKSFDVNTFLNASIVSDNHKSGITIFGTSRQRSPYDHNDDGFSEMAKIESQTVGFRAYYNITNYSRLSFEYFNIGEFRRGGNKLHLPAHEADIAEQVDHNINTAGLKYSIYSKDNAHRFVAYTSFQDVDRKSYYGAGKDLNAYGKTEDFSFSSGLQYTWNIEKLLFMPSEFTSGVEYSQNDLKDLMCGYNRKIEQNINIYSSYLQNEWKDDKYGLLLGVRADQHSLLKDPILSPRVNLRYSPAKDYIFRATYAQGSRAPQAFDEDLHVAAVGGRVALIRISPNLRTEKSHSYTLSADLYKSFKSVTTNLLIEGFYTQLNHVFVLEKMGYDSHNNIILERRNGEGAIVKGINFEGKVLPSRYVDFQAGFTIQTSEHSEGELWSDNPSLKPQRKMFRTPDRYGYLTANWNPKEYLTVSLSGTYTGPMLVQHYAGFIAEDIEKMTSEFFDINFRVSYVIKVNGHFKMHLNGGVQNILNSYQSDFDYGDLRDSGYIYGPSLPRTYFAGIKFEL